MSEFGNQFGLGVQTGIDIPHERRGVWPSREWKRAAKGQAWYPGDSVNMSIGQGYTLTTPLQLAVMTATIANRGVRYRPQFIRKLGNKVFEPIVEEVIDTKAEYWDAIFEGMEEVMTGARGTARRHVSQMAEYRMAGKSGTAQVIGIAQNVKYKSELLQERHRDHALFVAFAPVDDPQIAVAVMVENAESGSGKAAPVARWVMDAYLLGYYLKPGDEVPPFGYHSTAIIKRANAYIAQRQAARETRATGASAQSSSTPAGASR